MAQEVNKYLEKIAARVRVKGKHLHKAKEIVQEELVERAVDAAKEHYHKHRHGHEKKAIALTLYEDPKTGKTKWIPGTNPAPEGWIIKKKSYKKFNKKA